MMKDKTNRTLLGILVVLVAVYVVSLWQKKGSPGSQVLTTDLVHIDTSQISEIRITGGDDRILLTRQGNSWELTTEEGVQVRAQSDRVRSMLTSIDRLIPSRIISRDPSRWRDYQVDSTGRRIQIIEGDKMTLDLVIGRGNMQGQQTFVTYVRPYDENNVYVIENFSGSSVSPSSANYRNKTVLTTAIDSIHMLDFDYADDSEFVLTRVDGEWLLNDSAPDSSRLEDYLEGLVRVTSSAFVDQSRPATTDQPSASVTIRAHGAEDIFLRLYGESGEAQLLHSSQNPDNYFADTAVIKKVFVDRERFLP